MSFFAGHILVVDDYPMSGMKISRAVKQLGHTSELAENGQRALAMLRAGAYDLVLLDLLMPEMDGYDTLSAIKADPQLQEIPVIVISSEQEDMSSVTRCISLGALDYLPKLFDPVLLAARINSALEKKRVRDQELEYLQQVERLTQAAAQIENREFKPALLDSVGRRPDALGRLARVIQQMAREVYAREQRLEQQLARLRLDMAEMRRAQRQPLDVYVPLDRRHALAGGYDLARTANGAALFADISGFTPLTIALLRELGHRQGIEELPRHINEVFETLISQIHRYGGSVIGFSGDAITCWFDDRPVAMTPSAPASHRAVACAQAMQQEMGQVSQRSTFEGMTFTLKVKVAVVAGTISRFLVGNPQDSVLEVISGHLLHDLAAAEGQARPGEVVVSQAVVRALGESLTIDEWRSAGSGSTAFAVVAELDRAAPPAPWPALPSGVLTEAQLRPWIRPVLFERITAGGQQFLAELRLSVAMFIRFGDIDYDGDPQAHEKLDALVRWVQQVVARHQGMLVDLTIGDKGSYLFVVFGSPVAHGDDSTQAVAAALALLQEKPAALAFITSMQIGLTQGLTRTGSFGAVNRRAYSVFGDQVNLAARLMMAAAANAILGEAAIVEATQAVYTWEALPPIHVKGKAEAVAVFRPIGRKDQATAPVGDTAAEAGIISQLDALPAGSQLALKIASVLGTSFTRADLAAIFSPEEGQEIGNILAPLFAAGLVVPGENEEDYHFADETVRETVYQSMLFAQRRHLSRQVAEYLERRPAASSMDYARLAQHWQRAGERTKALDYLEMGGQQALIEGDRAAAERLIRQALELERAAG